MSNNDLSSSLDIIVFPINYFFLKSKQKDKYNSIFWKSKGINKLKEMPILYIFKNLWEFVPRDETLRELHLTRLNLNTCKFYFI